MLSISIRVILFLGLTLQFTNAMEADLSNNKRKRDEQSDNSSNKRPNIELIPTIDSANDNNLEDPFIMLHEDPKQVILNFLTVADLLRVRATCTHFCLFTQKEGTTLEASESYRWIPFYPNLNTLNYSLLDQRMAQIDPRIHSVDRLKDNDRITPDDAIALAEALKINTTITSLNLDCQYYIHDKQVEALAEMLMVNTTLTTLDLNSTTIYFKGAVTLANALKKNTTLTTLNLRHNPMKLSGVILLLRMLEVNTSIHTLDLSYSVDTDMPILCMYDRSENNESQRWFDHPNPSYLQFADNLKQVKTNSGMIKVLWAVVDDLKTKKIISPESHIDTACNFLIKVLRNNSKDSL